MKDTFDYSVMYDWEDANVTNKVEQHAYLSSNIQILSMFIDLQDLKDIKAAKDKYGTVPNQLSRALQTHVGESMWSEAKVVVLVEMFKADIGHQLSIVENLDFAMDDVRQFKSLMETRARGIVDAGAPSYDPTPTESPWAGHCCTVTMTTPNDYWEFPFEASLRTAAVNYGDAPKLPWEPILFDNGFPGALQATKVLIITSLKPYIH